MLKKILICVASLFLVSCFSPVDSGPANNFVINKIPNVKTKKQRRLIVFVNKPEAQAIYDTTDMAYTLYPYHISYFSKNGWAETPSRMLRPLMVQALQNSKHFYLVSSSPTIIDYHYAISTQILELQQVFTAHGSTVQFHARVVILNAKNGRVVATKEFNTSARAPQNSPYGGVLAANNAVADFLSQMTAFVLKKI